jgi:hypothetical protein
LPRESCNPLPGPLMGLSLFQLLNFWDCGQPDARACRGSPLESRAVGLSGQRAGIGGASGSLVLPDTFESAGTDWYGPA